MWTRTFDRMVTRDILWKKEFLVYDIKICWKMSLCHIILWKTPKLAQVSKEGVWIEFQNAAENLLRFAFILKIDNFANKQCSNVCLKCLFSLFSFFLFDCQTFFVWSTDKDEIFLPLCSSLTINVPLILKVRDVMVF